jgi:hypothetical protein
LSAAEKFTAQLLACEYHQRWEVENTIDELKVHLLGRKTHIRSQKPKEVVQEIYGLLLKPKSCKVIHFSSGKQRQHFTLASFFYWNITSCSSRAPKFSGVTTTITSLFLSWLTWEILDPNIRERVQRKNPRVVKKPGSKFRSKQVKHRGTGIIMNTPVFIVLSTA